MKQHLKQSYSSKDFDESQEVVTRESILKQSKEKYITNLKIEALKARFQDLGIS